MIFLVGHCTQIVGDTQSVGLTRQIVVTLGIIWHGDSRQTLSPWDPRSSRRREVSRASHCVEIRQPGILRASEQLLDAATVQKTTDQLPQFIRECRGFWTDQAKQEHERIIIIERGHDAVLGDRPPHHRGTAHPGTPAHADNRRGTCSGASPHSSIMITPARSASRTHVVGDRLSRSSSSVIVSVSPIRRRSLGDAIKSTGSNRNELRAILRV